MDPLHTLLRIAKAQYGCLTTAEAYARGVTDRELARVVRDGGLLHPFRGGYAVPPPEGTSPEDVHRLLCRCALRVYPDGALASVSAVVAHDLPVSGAGLLRPVVRRPVHRGCGVKGVVLRRQTSRQVDSPLGPTTPLVDALVELAIDEGTLPAVVSADAALRRRLVTGADLEEAVARARNWPGVGRAKAMCSLVDGRSESPGESLTRCELEMAGIPVTPQVEVRDAYGRFVARVDLMVDGTKVVVEFDGRVKYADGDRETLWKEKRREDRLRRLGYTVVRVTWADLLRPGGVVRLVRAALVAA